MHPLFLAYFWDYFFLKASYPYEGILSINKKLKTAGLLLVCGRERAVSTNGFSIFITFAAEESGLLQAWLLSGKQHLLNLRVGIQRPFIF